MPNISVLQFAHSLGAKTCGGMAQAVGLHWPPPPAISLREVIRLAGLPLAPTNLQLATSNGMGPITDTNNAPVTLDIEWQDAGQGTVRQATWYEVTVTNLSTGQLWLGRPFSAVPGEVVGMFPNLLDLYAHYQWSVIAANLWGRGPASTATFNTSRPAPSPPATPPPPPPPTQALKTGTLTLTLNAQNPQFGVQGVVWTVWHQTATGFGPPSNAFGLSGSITLSAVGQYQITAQVSVTRLATLDGEIAEFIGTTTGPNGIPTIVYVWNGGNVTKSFRVATRDDGGGLYHAAIDLVS